MTLIGIEAIDNAFTFIRDCWSAFWTFCDTNPLVMAFLMIDLVAVAVGVFFLVFGIFRRHNPQ